MTGLDSLSDDDNETIYLFDVEIRHRRWLI